MFAGSRNIFAELEASFPKTNFGVVEDYSMYDSYKLETMNKLELSEKKN